MNEKKRFVMWATCHIKLKAKWTFTKTRGNSVLWGRGFVFFFLNWADYWLWLFSKGKEAVFEGAALFFFYFLLNWAWDLTRWWRDCLCFLLRFYQDRVVNKKCEGERGRKCKRNNVLVFVRSHEMNINLIRGWKNEMNRKHVRRS